jgi:hypothetical protein
MLKAARTNEKTRLDFINKFVSRALGILEKSRVDDEYEAGISRREKRPIAELDALLAEAMAEGQLG